MSHWRTTHKDGCACLRCEESELSPQDYAALRVQLAEVKDELLAMTADRDSWREQADDRVDDVLRVSKERDEAYEVGRRRGQDEGEHVWRDELRAAVRERDEARVVAQRRGELLSDLQQERDELVCERDAALVRAEAAERERDLAQRAHEETNAALVKAEASDVESIAMCRRARDRAERYREALERFCTAWDKPNSSVFDVDLAYHAARAALEGK